MRIVTCFDGVDVDSWSEETCRLNQIFSADMPLIKLFAAECNRVNKFNLGRVKPSIIQAFQLSGLDYRITEVGRVVQICLVCKGESKITEVNTVQYDLHCEEERMECLAN